MRPVENGCDASFHRAECAHQITGIHVFGPVMRTELALHDLEIVAERGIRDDVAQNAFPHVPVGVDEPGHDDRAAGVDHLGVGRGEVRPHRGDLAAGDQHVGAFEIAHRWIKREHAAVLDQDRPTWRRRRARLCLCVRRRACHERRHSGCGRHTRAQKSAPRHMRRPARAAQVIMSHPRHIFLPACADRSRRCCATVATIPGIQPLFS